MKYCAKITVSLFLVMPILCSVMYGQKSEFKFKYITVDQGLSSNRVFCIYRDSKQFLWIGTDMGLNKYDGYQTTKYLRNNVKGSLSNNTLRCIAEDAEGNLLVGTEYGLNLYDRASDSFIVFNYDSSNSTSISSGNINSMYLDTKGNLWVLAGGSCLNKWMPKERNFIRYHFKEEDKAYYNPAQSIAEDSKGNIWVASYAPGLYCLKPGADKLTVFQDAMIDFGDKTTKSLFIDEKDIIWIASNGAGFHSFNPTTGKATHYLNNAIGTGVNKLFVRWIIDENNRYLLLAVNQGGINRFDKITKTFEYITYNGDNESGISSNGVWTFHRDSEGILWVGTGNGGVNYYNPKEYNFKLFRHTGNNIRSPSSNTIKGFYEDAYGMIWIGTDSEGVNIFDPKTKTFKILKHDPKNPFSVSGNTIRNIEEDTDKNVWVATWDAGLNKYDRKTGKFYHYMPDKNDSSSISGEIVWQVKRDSKGLLWLSILEKGINIFDKDKGVIKRFKADENNPEALGCDIIWQFVEDREKYMWICTWKGLYRYDRTTNKFRTFKNLPDIDIRTLYKDSKGNYWLGSFNKGLFKMDFEGNIRKVYNDKNGLPNNQIHAIVEDKHGNLWISTNYGLSQFNPEKETFRNYFKSDGLQGNQFFTLSYLKTRSGDLYFGGFDGFNSFNPDDLKLNPSIPPLYLTNFEIFNKPVYYGQPGSLLQSHISEVKQITIPWDQSVFSFGFTAINYTFPQKNQYAYKLEGFDKDWNEAGTNRSATYTNLDPGRYVFRVKGSNNDYIWNEEGTSIELFITPPYWLTWWFKAVVAITLAGSIFALTRIKISSIKGQKRELEKQVTERTAEIFQQKEELMTQAQSLKEANSEIKDSIRAALTIQQSILPSEKYIKKFLPESFILYKPKDVVSGDFYWFDVKDDAIVIAAVDCTGHGISGAFMSISGHHILNECIHPHKNLVAAEILDRLSEGVIKELNVHSDSQVEHGMDAALCIIDKERKRLQYAGANNPLYILRKNEIIQIKANKFPIGLLPKGKVNKFTNNELDVNTGDVIYIFSDGYADQIGGTNGTEKFKYPRFRELLIKIGSGDMDKQLSMLDNNLANWRGSAEQLDDVLVIGFRI